MFQRKALELLNCASVGLIGYYLGTYLYSFDIIPVVNTSLSSLKGILLYVIFMVFLFLSTHSLILWAYKNIKSKQKHDELDIKKQFVLLDQLEKQTRHGLADDPYTKALQTLVVTEALTPKATRKHHILKKANSADSHLLQNDTSNKGGIKKMWSSLRKVDKPQPVCDPMISPKPSQPAKLKPAPPPPTNTTPVAIHQSQRKVKQISSKVTSNSVNINVQKRIEELNKRNNFGGYENPALAIEEKMCKSKIKPFR